MSYFVSKRLSSFPELTHGFTTRETGDKIPGVVTLKQIHSNQVWIVEDNEIRNREGDALIIKKKGILVGVRTADCVPLLVYNPANKIAAAIHVGWRGLISGVIEATLQVLKNNFNSNFSKLQIVLGPALCPGCFEIGPDVASQFKDKFGDRLTISPGRNDRSFVDLRKACCLVLEDKGAPASSIEVLPHCTACEPELFYSYRRGDCDGRMLAFIGVV